jgi:hypothetical protein
MFSIDQLRLDIEALIREYPDLAEDEMLRADMLDGETDMRNVLSALFNAVDDNRSMIEAIKYRQQQLKERQARMARRVDFLRSLMLKVLQSANLRKVELAEATLSQRATQPQIIGEPSVDDLPRELLRVTVEPDRVKIREALIAGQTVPGVVLSNAPPTLSINAR